jgi:hypothetical protein
MFNQWDWKSSYEVTIRIDSVFPTLANDAPVIYKFSNQWSLNGTARNFRSSSRWCWMSLNNESWGVFSIEWSHLNDIGWRSLCAGWFQLLIKKLVGFLVFIHSLTGKILFILTRNKINYLFSIQYTMPLSKSMLIYDLFMTYVFN